MTTTNAAQGKQPEVQTREQKYANSVYKQVKTVPAQCKAGYGSLAHQLPILIHTAGLTQALAFVEARHKPDSPQRRLLRDLEVVLEAPNLAQRSREADLATYMLLTNKALAALLWFKRYAQSVLEVESAADSEVQDGR